MSTSNQNAIPPSISILACAMSHGLHAPFPDDVGQLLASATLIDIQDAPAVLRSAASSSDGDLNDATKGCDVPMFGIAQVKSGLVWLCKLAVALVVQITSIASDVVSLKDRVTAVESTPAVVYSQETESLMRQVSELCERVASQENRIAVMETSQRAGTDGYKKTIQELTTKIDDKKVDDKSRDDALEKLRDPVKYSGYLIESRGARITGVRADAALKIFLLQKELAGLRDELTAIKAVAQPTIIPSAGQATGQAPKAQVLAGVAEREVFEIAPEEAKKICPPAPVIVRSPGWAPVVPDTPTAPTPLGSQSFAPPTLGETKEAKVKIAKKPLTTALTNVIQPGAGKVPATPTIPKRTIMERLIPSKGKGKENRQCYSSTTTHQEKTPKPGAGQSPSVNKKLFSASPKSQLVPGLASRISALPKPRKSMLPAPRKSPLSSLAKHAEVANDRELNEVETADRLPGGSETQTRKPKTAKIAAIATPRPSLESSSSRVVEKAPAAELPTSSSLAALDAVLQAMEAKDDILLTQVPAPDCSSNVDDSSFSGITTHHFEANRNGSVHVPPKQRRVDVRSPRSPLRPTLATSAGNEALPTSSSLDALEVAVQKFNGEGNNILTFIPIPGVDFTFSATTPVFTRVRPPFERESIYVPPVKISATKPSRRL